MLKRLVIKNFAIIEDIDISFNDGLTVLTGETGAGKSLLIDSISLLLGDRANTELIRTGFDKAIITGYFHSTNIYLKSILEANKIDYSEDLVITRTIDANKSTAKVNGTAISISELKRIAHYLADIHQQFDMTKLLDSDNYLEMVDGIKFDLINEYKTNYLDALKDLRVVEQEYLALIKKHDELLKRKEEYEYIVKEIEGFGLYPNEEKDIEDRISLLKNFDTIYALLQENKSLIEKDGLDDLYLIKENLAKLANYQSEYQDYYNKLDEYYYEIDEIYKNLKDKVNNVDYDPNELNNLIERESDLNSLKRKYNMSLEELINYKDEIKASLTNEENYDYLLLKAENKFHESFEKTYKKAVDLTNIRQNVALNMEKELIKHLADLDLKVKFKINVTPKENKDYDTSIFLNEGIDEVNFLIETNIGEGLKPLAKIISGGEASRIMLAFKMLFVKSQNIETIIFDEVDTGISGTIARKVGLKLYELSLNHQVIAITHLPQVASLSKTHLKIKKDVIKGRTYTNVKELSLEEKINEIASLLSNDKITATQIEYAKELIENKH